MEKLTVEKMQEWLHECLRTNSTHMLLVSDRSDGKFDIFPVRISEKENIEKTVEFYNQQEGYKVLEIYNMSLPLDIQLYNDIPVYNI